MNIEKFIEIVMSNPDNVEIQYSNINGKEKLIVNGEDLTKDSEIKLIVADYKDIISEIDDNDFVQIVEKLNEEINLEEFDKALNQESFSQEDADNLIPAIQLSKDIIKEYISEKIESLNTFLERL